MTVYLFSTSYEIGQIINDNLLSLHYSSFLFDTGDNLIKTLCNQKKLPDLLVLDYTIFNHDFFNIYTYLNQEKKELPVIFYNDPCITASTRTKHWIYQLEILTYRESDRQYTDEEIESYRELFRHIEEIVSLEELAPYIKLMQKEKPLPNSLKKQTLSIDYIRKNTTCNIYDFRNKTNLPTNLFFLLKIFQQNSGIPLRPEDILSFYEKEGKQMTSNSLKVLISNLRKEIRNDKDCHFMITNIKGAYTFTSLREF